MSHTTRTIAAAALTAVLAAAASPVLPAYADTPVTVTAFSAKVAVPADKGPVVADTTDVPIAFTELRSNTDGSRLAWVSNEDYLPKVRVADLTAGKAASSWTVAALADGNLDTVSLNSSGSHLAYLSQEYLDNPRRSATAQVRLVALNSRLEAPALTLPGSNAVPLTVTLVQGSTAADARAAVFYSNTSGWHLGLFDYTQPAGAPGVWTAAGEPANWVSDPNLFNTAGVNGIRPSLAAAVNGGVTTIAYQLAKLSRCETVVVRSTNGWQPTPVGFTETGDRASEVCNAQDRPVLSGDGNQLLFSAYPTAEQLRTFTGQIPTSHLLYVRNLDSAKSRRVTPDADVRSWSETGKPMAISDNGNKVAWQDGPEGLDLYNLENGQRPNVVVRDLTVCGDACTASMAGMSLVGTSVTGTGLHTKFDGRSTMTLSGDGRRSFFVAGDDPTTPNDDLVYISRDTAKSDAVFSASLTALTAAPVTDPVVYSHADWRGEAVITVRATGLTGIARARLIGSTKEVKMTVAADGVGTANLPVLRNYFPAGTIKIEVVDRSGAVTYTQVRVQDPVAPTTPPSSPNLSVSSETDFVTYSPSGEAAITVWVQGQQGASTAAVVAADGRRVSTAQVTVDSAGVGKVTLPIRLADLPAGTVTVVVTDAAGRQGSLGYTVRPAPQPTPTPTPTTPTALTVTTSLLDGASGTASLTVTVTGTSGAGSAQVFTADGGTALTGVVSLRVNATSPTVGTATFPLNRSTFPPEILVRVVDRDGRTATKTLSVEPPKLDVSLNAVSASSATIGWSAPPGVRADVKVTGSGFKTYTATNVSTNSVSVTGLASGRDYDVTVTSRHGDVRGPDTHEVLRGSAVYAPSSRTVSRSKAKKLALTLTAKPVTGDVGGAKPWTVTLQQRSSKSSWKTLKTVTVTGTTASTTVKLTSTRYLRVVFTGKGYMLGDTSSTTKIVVR